MTLNENNYIQSIRFSTSKKTVIFIFRFMLFMDNQTWYLSSLSSYIYVHLFLMIVPSDHNYWIDIHVIFGHWLFRSFIGHLPLIRCCHWLKMTAFSSLISNVKRQMLKRCTEDNLRSNLQGHIKIFMLYWFRTISRGHMVEVFLRNTIKH